MIRPKNDAFYEKIAGLKAFDCHTHIDAAHSVARGLHDVLLYHMVISDLYSAGCPDGSRLSEDPSDEEAAERIEQAIDYLPAIQNTSCAATNQALCTLARELPNVFLNGYWWHNFFPSFIKPADVLWDKIEFGQYDEDTALEIAQELFYGSAAKLFKVQ